MTPEQRAFADTLSLRELLATHARAHEIYNCQFKGMALFIGEDGDPFRRYGNLPVMLEAVEKMLEIGVPELIDQLSYLAERMRNELSGNAPAAGGEQG